MDQSPPDPRQRLYLILFHCSWIGILLAAAYQRLMLPLTPLADNDIWGFLNPGLQSLTGHGFQHTDNRNSLYPRLICVLLEIFQDFRAITLVQRLLGLATGGLMLASWCAARRCFVRPSLPPWFFDLAGLLTMSIYLFATEPVQFEYFIRPDVVCPFFAALALYLIVRFLVARKVERNSRTTAVLGASVIFVALFIPNLKPSFWLTSVFITIPVWLAAFDRKEALRRRLLMTGVPLIAAALLLWLPEKILADRDIFSDRFLPESLFSIHGMIIREQLADDAAHPDPSVPYSQAQLRSVLAFLDAGIAASLEKSPHHMETLGYDADFLLYHQPFFDQVTHIPGFTWRSVIPFFRYYYLRAWQKRPLEMLQKAGKQLALFYNLSCPAYCDKRFEMARYYTRSLDVLSDPVIQKTLRQFPPAMRWMENQQQVADNPPLIDMNKTLRRTINAFGNCYFPTLLVFLALLPWVLWSAGRRARFGLISAVLIIGYCFNFGNNLGIAVLHTLEVSRYTYVQFATTVWTETLTFIFLVEFLLQFRRGVPGAVAIPIFKSDSHSPLTSEKPA
jgi:hypothetical protein